MSSCGILKAGELYLNCCLRQWSWSSRSPESNSGHCLLSVYCRASRITLEAWLFWLGVNSVTQSQASCDMFDNLIYFPLPPDIGLECTALPQILGHISQSYPSVSGLFQKVLGAHWCSWIQSMILSDCNGSLGTKVLLCLLSAGGCLTCG